MSSKQMKKKESANRLNSAQGGSPTKELTSSMNHTSPLNALFEQKGKFTMWPEWSDADINSEKWDSGKVLKDKDKSGKSAALYFDDPEGKIDLPSNLKISSWKRPHEFITSALPVVIKDENSFDLMSRNEHLFGSELMRWIISEISAVWRIYNTNLTPNKLTAVEPSVLVWKPWEHIYALCKVTKGHMPLYNSYGKYVVKLYWMGCWRKIIVDDAIPFNEENLLLLPVTTCETELWPLLLSKAIIKIANADTKGFAKRELGEFTVIHALTGWLPEVLPLENYYIKKVWDFLKATVPEFKHPDDEQPEPKDLSPEQNSKEIKKAEFGTEIPVPVILKSSEKTSKEKTEAKETGKKKADKEKIRSAPHSARPPSDLPVSSQPLLRETSSLSQNSQMIVYASYLPLHLNEKKITVLGQMADSSEKLRQYGLPHILSHPVLVTRTRSCPLVAPPKPIPIPRWKLIRPQRAVNITDEPKEPVQKKNDQFVEITTPFLNFQLDPTDISTEKLSHMASHLKSVSEDEENIQESDVDLKEIRRVSATESAMEIATAEDHRSPGENIEGESGGENVPQDTLATDVTSQPCPLENPPEEKSLDTNPVSKDIWMDFSDFCKCFQTLYVFHKPKTYPYTYQKSNFKPSTNGELYYLCVDNLKSTEILVSFSALVRWGETASENESASQSGLLFAEKFSWKSISTGHFVLRISTDLTKAAMIRLPPGRHLLRFTATSPLGYHIHLCSTVPFVFGDEETVMPHLEKESYRFVEQASRIVRAILNVMIHFNNKEELPKAVKELDLTVCSQGTKLRLGKTKEHYEIFNKALWHLITEVMGNKVTLDLVLAYRAFTLDFSSLTSTQTSLPTDHKHEVPITWQNRSATSLEEAAAVKLQACLKGSYVRKLWHSRKPDNRENTIIRMTLDKLVNLLEPNAEQFGAPLLRYLIKHSPASRELYACCNDEPYRISYMDYTVSYPEQPPNTWFVVFREVFYMPEDMLLTPVIFSTIPVCNLYVINNDTLKEIPWVFTKVPPYVYTKNIRGYTFMAQAYTGEAPLVPGKFKLRLIGDHKPLPSISRENPNNSFAAKETKGFYIPNGDNVIFRYTVKAAIDHMATVQVQTSKPDVLIKVQIMDNGEELLSVTGKGRALIPGFCFFTNERPLSSSSSRSQLLLNGSKKGRITSGGSLKNNKTSSRPESKLDVHCAETESLEEKIQHQLHKYIIQATVLNDSWKLTESQAAFVESLRESEKQESQVFGEKQEGIVADITNGDDAKSINTPKTARKGKEGKEKTVEKSGKDKVSSAPNSRPASQDQANHSDPSKPLWFLQLTSETSEAGTLEVKKDTARIDEIKSMKQAWELADPGRAVKALQSRLQYINKNMQKVLSPPASETEDSQGDPIANGERTENIFQPATVTTSNINLPFSQRELEPMDLTPLIRRNSSETAVRDEAFIQQQAVRKAEEIKEWQALREQILALREQAQVERNFLKNEFLQKYEDLQLSLDNAREEIFRIREAYRSQLLESDRQKQEALLAEEAALKAVQEKVTPSGQKRKSAKGSKK